MRDISKKCCFIIFVGLFFFLVQGQHCLALDPYNKTLRFGVFPYKSPRTVMHVFAPLVKLLKKNTGYNVQLVTTPDFKTFNERGAQGSYDIAFPCVTCYFHMTASGYKVIAAGDPGFYGGVIVRKDSEIKTIAQLKGKRVASVGKNSYGGHLFIYQQLVNAGLHPDKDVDFFFLGKLDSIIFGVVNRKFDAGTIRLDALDSPVFDNMRDKISIISRSEAIPQFPFVVKDDLDPSLIQKVQQVLVELSPETIEGRRILNSLRIKSIVKAEDGDYDDFRSTINNLTGRVQ